MNVIVAHWADGQEVLAYEWENDGQADTVLIYEAPDSPTGRVFRYNIRPDGLVGSYITEVMQ